MRLSKRSLKRKKKAAAKAAVKACEFLRREDNTMPASLAQAQAPPAPPSSPVESIDAIFAKAKRPATDSAGADGKSKNGGASKKKAMRRAKRPKNGSIDDPLGRSGDWADDGLGGIYNKEGWTGRHTDDNLRIFKAHLIKVGQGGGSPNCPFDCDCCY
ncbi:unnamed protein product [Durusdinium trenchii]|uniref:Uncharacterized protein n=2 Tax=Durusdinium trenchii TaxID=1381693 RepID=A0ABP0P4V7_9DINO